MKLVTTALFVPFLVFQVSAAADNGTSNARDAPVSSSPNHIGTVDIKYQDCSLKQKAMINEAVSRANMMISRAQFYLENHKTSKRKTVYTTWFGPAEAKRYDAVSSRFNRMRVQASSFTYDCNVCGVQYPAPAYLVPESSLRTIRLCENFWGKFLGTKKNFKAGWIIRELSRAPDMGGAKLEDWSVDLKGAKKLAKQPDDAVMSPDNYMYFAIKAPVPR